MMVDPFAFLRGAAAVMATDLAHQPLAGAPVQACGDCHLMNFGAFNSPEDNILFDINDFDETLPGVDFTVDVKRLAASVAVAAKAGDHVGQAGAQLRGKHGHRLSRTHVRAHGAVSARNLAQPDRSSNKSSPHRESGTAAQPFDPDPARSASRSRQGRQLSDLVAGGEPRIADKQPTIFHLNPKTLGGRTIDFARGFALYRETLTPDRSVLLDRYRLMDVAFKAVGVGSVGTICVVGLFLSGDGEPIFLQVKQAQRSVLERLSKKLAYQGPQGRRVVEGQRMMQAASDILLGWTSDEPLGIEFYVRILKNRRPRRGQRARRAAGAFGICPAVRPDARALPRPLRRSGRHRRLHGKERGVRRRARFVRHGLCRADGQGSRRAGEGQGRRQGRSGDEEREVGAEVRLTSGFGGGAGGGKAASSFGGRRSATNEPN